MKNFIDAGTLFQLIPQDEFNRLAKKWFVDKKVRRFTTLKQLKVMCLSYILGLKSLREVELVLGVPKSTFSDACQTRSSGFFRELAQVMMYELLNKTKSRKEKKALRDVIAVDGTHAKAPKYLARMFGWRSYSEKNTGEIKIHAAWNVGNKWIENFNVTSGVASELTEAKKFKYRSGCTYVFDRAYVDLSLWIRIEKAGAHFVTRLKRSEKEKRRIKNTLKKNEGKVGVLHDGEWYPTEMAARRANDYFYRYLAYRQVIYRDPETKKVFNFITSDFEKSAEDVAAIYRARWSVELLFKWMKGHMGIRSFSMRSKNAIKSWVAVSHLLHLLISIMHKQEESKRTLWEYYRELKYRILFKLPYPWAFKSEDTSKSSREGPLHGRSFLI